MAKNWLKNLSDEKIFDFINSHFMEKVCQKNFQEFKENNIIRYMDSNGYHISVFFECEEYQNFFASIELNNYFCIVKDKEGYPMYIGEDKKYSKKIQNRTNKRSTLLDFRLMMIKECGPDYANKLSQKLLKEIINMKNLYKVETKIIKTLCDEYKLLFNKEPTFAINQKYEVKL